ncbi:MAG: 3'-5' exonuclease [Rhodobacteraceae bacterium]|jgi:DNA polymerase-3 subunit epsilon|nr:3'-5' exonuclease [Paracoccaceae bacterium]
MSLRRRIMLFFAALAAGFLAAVAVGLVLGLRQVDDPQATSALITTAATAAFLSTGLVAGIWLLFDENVARPIERLAADLRARAHAGVAGDLETASARYLGDLAPAAAALSARLGTEALDRAEALARHTAALEAEKASLTALLTDIPLAVLILSPDRHIVLYDGQAADILSRERTPRLGAALADYLDDRAVALAEERLAARDADAEVFDLSTRSGAIRLRGVLKRLGTAPGFLLTLEPVDEAPLPPSSARPLVYDFALLDRAQHARIDDRPLAALTYVVFDTETTGLQPHRDEVVQIGALRIVNGRIVPGEVIDQLVNPGIPIPAASTAIHGIATADVAGAPGIEPAARAFHDFCAGAVIVAHNAPFDIAFMNRHAGRTGVTFDHPVLDTVLMSAVIWGAATPHTLDALADRLGAHLPAQVRHTALGDARATAEVFLRMLPILQSRGITTFGALVAETQKHGRLLQDLNTPGARG